MNKQDTTIYNAAAIFSRPLKMKGDGKIIYGVLYNKELEKQREGTLNDMEHYMCYLKAMEDFLHNGGDTSQDKKIWKFDGYSIQCNTAGFQILLSKLFKVYTKYSTIEFDQPLDYTSDEVDDCFIIGYTFMERHVFPFPDKIHNRY